VDFKRAPVAQVNAPFVHDSAQAGLPPYPYLHVNTVADVHVSTLALIEEHAVHVVVASTL